MRYAIALITVLCGVSRVGHRALSAEDLTAQIKKEGPAAVLAQLWKHYDDQWNYVLNQVAKGPQGWLDVALLLRPVADAGARETLDEAIGDALEAAPERVLALMTQEDEVLWWCSLGSDPYDTKALAVAAVELRIKRVAGVKRPDLAGIRDECLKYLRQERIAIEKDYAE